MARGLGGVWEARQIEGLIAWMQRYERALAWVAVHGDRDSAMMAGCSSARTGDDKPRGGQTRYIAHPWNANAGPAAVETEWLPRSCCHSERATDAACEGCVNRGDK